MQIEKKVISNLNKCYSLSEITVEGKHCFLVAAEKKDPCYLFAEDGTQLETVWTEPGGVMTMAPLPGTDGKFLATHKFYSPNDSADARIILAERVSENNWSIRTLCHVPFVHRFGILQRAGVTYIIACCLKSGHEYKNDWRYAGACYGGVLPEDLSAYDDSNPLPMTLLMDGMLKNHGYSKISHGGHDAALVACEEGTFIFDPPMVAGGEWDVTQVSPVPSSDSVLMDFDGDGKPELGMISPFHGNSLTIWHLDEHDNYVPQWKYSAPEAETEMIHATWTCELLGKPTWIVGWRKGTKKTIAISWDAEAGDYRADLIDENTGCANALHFKNAAGEDVIIGTNREIDEVAYYTIK